MIVQACWAGSRAYEENPAWRLVRGNLRERDQSLAPEALSWLSALPWTVQPKEMCARYPRIANRMALVWPDAHLTALYFKSLLQDKRGGRRGFASSIQQELMALRSYHAELRGMRSGHEAAIQAACSPS